jgi:CIC family chloride channel protein
MNPRTRRPAHVGLFRLSLLAIIVGVITGFGAVAFRALIGLFHNVAFLKLFSFAYDASVFTPPSPWGPFIILVPVIGGLIVTFLIVNFCPRGAGPRRAGGDGRDLLQGRRDPADRGFN